jgi:hypothetical protein
MVSSSLCRGTSRANTPSRCGAVRGRPHLGAVGYPRVARGLARERPGPSHPWRRARDASDLRFGGSSAGEDRASLRASASPASGRPFALCRQARTTWRSEGAGRCGPPRSASDRGARRGVRSTSDRRRHLSDLPEMARDVSGRTTGEFVVVHHNDAVRTRCAGSGPSPVAGSVIHQSPGREIARGRAG